MPPQASLTLKPLDLELPPSEPGFEDVAGPDEPNKPEAWADLSVERKLKHCETLGPLYENIYADLRPW